MTTSRPKQERTNSRKTSNASRPVETAGDRPVREPAVSDADIARLAHELFLANGAQHGHDLEDWLEAERRIRNRDS
jgi:hypothetical protein